MIKAQNKTVKYAAWSDTVESKPKSQASDYYIGVFDEEKDKCYLVPVSAAYQMTQRIDGFAEAYASKGESAQDFTYYEQKKMLAQSFGTAKAQRHL